MSQSIIEDAMNEDEQSISHDPEVNVVKDYDDEPNGDDNILVRASKRRSFFLRSSRF